MGTGHTAFGAEDPPADHVRGDIGSAFDDITYEKGAAVIRMFENYVGPEQFPQRHSELHAEACLGQCDRARFLSCDQRGFRQRS